MAVKPAPTIKMVDEDGQGWHIKDFTIESVEWPWLSIPKARFTIDPYSLAARTMRYLTIGKEIFIELESGDQWWGMPTGYTGGETGPMTIECDGILRWIVNRFVDRSSLEFAGIEQKTIVRDLIFYAQSEEILPYRYHNIWPRIFEFGFGVKTRYRKYSRWDKPNILDSINEFTSVDPPIGYRMSWENLGTVPQGNYIRYFDIFAVSNDVYPLSFPLRWVEGREGTNIASFKIKGSTDGLKNNTWSTGGSAGDVRFEGHAVSGTSVQVHGDQTAVVSFGDSKDPTWLTDQAHQYSEDNRGMKIDTEIESVIIGAEMGPLVQEGQVWPIDIQRGAIKAQYNARILNKQYIKGGRYKLTFSAPVIFDPEEELVYGG